MYTHAQIEEFLQLGMKMLREINIPISDSINPKVNFPKAHSFYGQCYPHMDRGYAFTIRISEYTLGSSYTSIMNTVLHELLHTCPGCLNHQKLWQSYAKKVNETYGYNIKRCDGDKTEQDKANLSYGMSGPTHFHRVKCDRCGHVIVRTRESNLTLHPERYRCKCGGHIIRID